MQTLKDMSFRAIIFKDDEDNHEGLKREVCVRHMLELFARSDPDLDICCS